MNGQLRELAEAAGLEEHTLRFVWAAYGGSDSLEAALEADEPVIEPEPESALGSVPVWLNSIAVNGFRGIGPRAELVLDPGPGLTLIVGRNGSGKSSFAEALEALLTGDNQRWKGRPAAWLDGWRNLHDGDSVSVTAEFQREHDSMPCAITRAWNGGGFSESELAVELNGSAATFDSLGWEGPLASYKPFLSYNELGSMLEQKPSAIYDSLAGVLGLERLTEARERIRAARLEAEKPSKELKKSKDGLKTALAAHDDPRASDALLVLAKISPDLGALAVFATTHDQEGSRYLGRLSDLNPPDESRCHDAADNLEAAMQLRASHAETDAGRAARVADLLSAAITHRDHEGDVSCPVCGAATLDETWLAEATAQADSLRQQSHDIEKSERAVTTTRQAALACLVEVPPILEPTTEVVDTTRAFAAWTIWTSQPDGGFDEATLLGRLRDTADLARAVNEVQASARAELERMDENWRPVATEIAAWISAAHTAAISKNRADALKQAEEFYKSAEATLREVRFAPIAQRAAELWDGLRQQSNVSLERVALEGKTTTRRVDLDVTVDGTETSALGVMSQGELHALALALFLPRVTATESPFRFVLIDDPVQAMDPARVDGLARTLVEVASTRQVIVFTHDDRLPAACRRLDLEANVVEVDRRSGSRVSTRPTDTPARTALSDAYALAKTEKLPPELRRQIVPVHCRRAVEAAARDQAWRQLLGSGRSHQEIDQCLADASKTTDLLGVLFFGRAGDPRDVYDELARQDQKLPGILKYLNSSVHHPTSDLDPAGLVNGARILVSAIEAYSP